jgi:hypothetical protein
VPPVGLTGGYLLRLRDLIRLCDQSAVLQAVLRCAALHSSISLLYKAAWRRLQRRVLVIADVRNRGLTLA